MNVKITRVTEPPAHHFFGYYDKWQWDPAGRYLLTLQTDFMDRAPTGVEEAVVGMVDLHAGNLFSPLTTTKAWCWQQGSMLQWLPGATGRIIFNDRIADRYVSVILDVQSGERRTLPRPIYTVSPDGRWALSLNFSRLQTTRPGYGYAGLRDHWADEGSPAGDGVYLMDLHTGNHRLIVEIASLAEAVAETAAEGVNHWVNHLLFNPKGDRFVFLHRWKGGRTFLTRFYTAAKDGSDRRSFAIDGASHFIWYDDDRVLVWANTEKDGAHYYLVNDRTGEAEPFAPDKLTRDGHCTRSPDGRSVLTDEYPNSQGERPLILYRPDVNQRIDLAHFFSPPSLTGELRCDLHPRWSRDGRYISVDSAHEGSRQVYVVSLGEIA